MAITEKYVSSSAGGSGNGLSAGSPFTFAQMVSEVASGGTPGVRYNVKADGTYNRGGTVDDMGGGNGNTTSPISIRGYKTTIGDGYLGRTGGNGALITTNMPSITYPSGGGGFVIGVNMAMECLNITGVHGSDQLLKVGRECVCVATTVTNSAVSDWAQVARIAEFSIVFDCDFINSSATTVAHWAVYINAGFAKLDSCRIIVNSPLGSGVEVEANGIVANCLIKGGGGGIGVNIADGGRQTYFRNNTIMGWQDGIMFNMSMSHASFIGGNMITDNSRWGVNFNTTSCPCLIGPNRTRDNVSGATNNASQDWLQVGRVFPLVTTDTGGPETDYVNTATNDLNLIPASPGKGGNRPMISDLGAYGLPDPSGGGGSAVFNPLAQTIIRPAS